MFTWFSFSLSFSHSLSGGNIRTGHNTFMHSRMIFLSYLFQRRLPLLKIVLCQEGQPSPYCCHQITCFLNKSMYLLLCCYRLRWIYPIHIKLRADHCITIFLASVYAERVVTHTYVQNLNSNAIKCETA